MEIIIFIVGLLLGSFFNVVGTRLPEKRSIVKPRSHCPKCNHVLSWYENIPVFSFIALRGKCLGCKRKISWMYPIIELLTGFLFAISYALFGFSESFYIALIISSLVVLVYITDSLYMVILDEALLIGGLLIFIVKLIFQGVMPALISVGYGLLIFGVVFLIMFLGNIIFKKESMGGGDIKLSFIAGMVLGPFLGLFYLALGAFLAFPYALYVIIKNNDGILPFGPFLATSMFFCYVNAEMLTTFLRRLLGFE